MNQCDTNENENITTNRNSLQENVFNENLQPQCDNTSLGPSSIAPKASEPMTGLVSSRDNYTTDLYGENFNSTQSFTELLKSASTVETVSAPLSTPAKDSTTKAEPTKTPSALLLSPSKKPLKKRPVVLRDILNTPTKRPNMIKNIDQQRKTPTKRPLKFTDHTPHTQARRSLPLNQMGHPSPGKLERDERIQGALALVQLAHAHAS